MYISRRIVILLFVGLALVGAIAYALLTLSFVRTPDGILVLYQKQAKECAEGGGCAIFSQREFEAAVFQILARQRRTRADPGT